MNGFGIKAEWLRTINNLEGIAKTYHLTYHLVIQINLIGSLLKFQFTTKDFGTSTSRIVHMSIPYLLSKQQQTCIPPTDRLPHLGFAHMIKIRHQLTYCTKTSEPCIPAAGPIRKSALFQDVNICIGKFSF